ncbi:MAG: hypothetical protein RIR33_2582 [Pseudomonadota bacterium]|jgi:lipopolysaccharide/colanic/teichoic acid biosynthesis glycosyltransferase
MEKGGGLNAGRFDVWGDAPPAGTSYRVQTSGLKRAMDVAIAFPLVIFLAPMLLTI